MLRKHMISENFAQTGVDTTPFFAWQCITICLTNREIDLIIPNDKDMDDFIEMIVSEMNTVDG